MVNVRSPVGASELYAEEAGQRANPHDCSVRKRTRLCENAAVAAQRKVGAGAGFCFGVRDRRTVQARITSISDCGLSMATTRFRL
jgi:hypothetical protein